MNVNYRKRSSLQENSSSELDKLSKRRRLLPTLETRNIDSLCEEFSRKNIDVIADSNDDSSIIAIKEDSDIEMTNSNVLPVKVACKFPDGTRKIFHLTTQSTVKDLKQAIYPHISSKVDVNLRPKERSILSYSDLTLLSSLGVDDNTMIYIIPAEE
ncbi:hypothetical protein RF11_06783 [Thelohanellus kitauei]|uniref:Ubiquitin-like domain-containing protein n=1 Tax=Thelohanellus kitauei TaxID=669202 RepID=A0A0C2ISB3_THEKT|nr:hypothetical protein RF11_06783 [Thelohanellus kitauei]